MLLYNYGVAAFNTYNAACSVGILLILWYFDAVIIFTDLPLETHIIPFFLRSKGGCTGSVESTLVKKPHCWKSHVAAHM